MRRMRTILWIAVWLGLSSTFLERPVEASGLLIADGGRGGLLEIKEHEVSVVINNGIAVTKIRQVFRNTEQRTVEALYTFPVPNAASVSNFSMIINGKEMVGEVVEKKRARQIYESYKAVNRDPGLLEQVDFKSFELRIFPIAAGAEQHIEVTYYQQLDFDHDNATYVYPLATTTRPNAPNSSSLQEKTVGKFAFTIDVKSEIPIVQMSSPSHSEDFVISSHGDHYTRASLEVQEGDLSRDVVIAFDTERARTGIDVITSKQKGEDGYFMMTMTAGKEMESYGEGMDYVFVVDISGSMANDGKLTLSRQVVDSFVKALASEDRFEVMAFNSVPQLKFEKLSPVNEESQKEANEFLFSQRAKGGTVLRPAITTAYKYKDGDRPLNVVILSDGMTENREQAELLALIGSAPSGTRVFCIGIGNDVNRPLLKQLAEGAGGLAAFVSQQDDFARQSQAFRRKLMRPVASNVRLAIDGVDTYDVTPEALPDLFYGAPLRVLGRYRKSGMATITISAEIQGQPMNQSMTVELPELQADNPEIERMWAFHQVQKHMDRLRSGGHNEQTIDKIVQLCEGYSIVSEYASFIVLENEAEYKRWAIERRNAVRIRRDETARQRLQVKLEKLREESLASLGPSTDHLVSEPLAKDEAGRSRETVTTAPSTAQSPVTTSAPTDLNWSVPQSSGSPTSGGHGGGGAIDPISGLIAAGLMGAAGWARRRRKPQGESGDRSTTNG